MFGSHLSIAGGMHNALLKAEEHGFATVQVFTKNQQQWKCKPLDEAGINEWKKHRKRLKFTKTVSHDSYLINLASADDLLWRKSVDLFVEEVMRCKLLGIEYLVTHPGAHLGTGSAADSLNVATKIDLPGNIFPDEIPISAATGENLDQLRERLDSLAFGETAGGESLALNARHLHAIEQARAALSRADNQTAAPEIIAMELREALDALGQILCNVAPDDVLGRIFATFCVGK